MKKLPPAIWRDENLLIICAVEGYAHQHNMTTKEASKLFRNYGEEEK
jgi:hypothetical protein